MATSYSQDPNGQKDSNADSGAAPENQQKAQDAVAKNAAARRALPYIIAGIVLIALIAFAATSHLRKNNANSATSSDSSGAASTQGSAPAPGGSASSGGGGTVGSEGGASGSNGGGTGDVQPVGDFQPGRNRKHGKPVRHQLAGYGNSRRHQRGRGR